MSVTLTSAEAQAVLERFDTTVFGALRVHPTLLSAVLKLNGTLSSRRALWVLRTPSSVDWAGRSCSNKIQLIKAVRTLLNMGLKEAKDYVELPSNLRPNGDLVIDPSSYPRCDNIQTARLLVDVEIDEEAIA